MNVGIFVCVILAALSYGSLSLPSQMNTAESTALVSDNASSPNLKRQARSASAPAQPQDYADSPNSLSHLVARLISRKGSSSQPRSFLTSRASGLAPSHRIKDRDYLGWMDFGRRSAEEYEY